MFYFNYVDEYELVNEQVEWRYPLYSYIHLACIKEKERLC